MAQSRPRSDFFRAWMSSLVASAAAVGAYLLVHAATDLEVSGTWETVITVYVFFYPVYAAVYVGWGLWTYTRLGPARLSEVASDEHRTEHRPLHQALGMTGTTSTTISAAIMAVVVTVGIAQTPQFRAESLYLVGGLLTVASAWVLMVFSFSQAYLRLAARSRSGAPIRFPFPDQPRFGDYLTLAILMSTMAATVSAEITTRPAWRLVRANVVVAFAFNTVIIAMTVSLLFGSLTQ